MPTSSHPDSALTSSGFMFSSKLSGTSQAVSVVDMGMVPVCSMRYFLTNVTGFPYGPPANARQSICAVGSTSSNLSGKTTSRAGGFLIRVVCMNDAHML